MGTQAPGTSLSHDEFTALFCAIHQAHSVEASTCVVKYSCILFQIIIISFVGIITLLTGSYLTSGVRHERGYGNNMSTN